MSIIARHASRAKTNPAPVRHTVVLFDGGARRPSPWFGQGILRAVPTRRLPCTLDDVQWAAASFADPEADRRAAERELAADYADAAFNAQLAERELEVAYADRCYA
jgi:hypothetical protein